MTDAAETGGAGELIGPVAVIGGTGGLGRGLCYRLARAGLAVAIGSRDAGRARDAAAALTERLPGAQVTGTDNASAVAAAPMLAALCVPFDHAAATLDDVAPALAGKILLDTTVCLRPPKVGRVQLPAEGAACVQAQARLGDGVRVVAALQNVAAAKLDADGAVACDVLVCGDSKAARAAVIALLARIGLDAWHAGPIANAAAVEAMTSVLITINRQYGTSAAGLRITGASRG